jgi:hypothetical protein
MSLQTVPSGQGVSGHSGTLAGKHSWMKGSQYSLGAQLLASHGGGPASRHWFANVSQIWPLAQVLVSSQPGRHSPVLGTQ